MHRRTAGLLLLPISFIFLMTTNVHSDNRPSKAAKATSGPPGATQLSADQQQWVEATLRSMTL